MRILVIPATLSKTVEVREINGDLSEYQEIVQGNIEATDVPELGISFFSNEEGLIQGLSDNIRATAVLYIYAPEHRNYTILVGDVVVVGMPDKDGNTTSVPQGVIELLTQ